MEELYCKIYINTDMSKKSLLSFIAENVKGNVKMRTIYATTFEIDVVNNEDADSIHTLSSEKGFLYYPYYLDVEPSEKVNRDLYITSIKQLLQQLWETGASAVASCDFEKELNVSS